MNIGVNNVITLNNDEKYLVLSETEYNNNKYYYLIGVTPDGEELNDKIKIMTEVTIDGKLSLKVLKDPDIIEQIKQLLADNLAKNEF